jgi:hypothetical protein
MTEGPSGAPTPLATEPIPAFEQEGRFSISEDWAATIVGLILVVLVLAGVITGTFMKGLIP